MLQPHAVNKHALWYLTEARRLQASVGGTDFEALLRLNPPVPCKAFGIARWALHRYRSLDGAIRHLEQKYGVTYITKV